jgi:hypothetical protein
MRTILENVKGTGNLPLSEGLIVTRAIDMTISFMHRNYGDQFTKFLVDSNDPNIVRMLITGNFKPRSMKHYLTTMNNLGWFPASYGDPLGEVYERFNEHEFIKYASNPSNLPVNVWFEAKYDLGYSLNAMPDVLYHAAPVKFESKIDKIGLCPKSMSQLHTQMDRVYLALSPDSVQQLVRNPEFHSTDDEFVIYQVAVKALSKKYVFDLYNDPAYRGEGVYTYSNVPPEYLTKVDRFTR